MLGLKDIELALFFTRGVSLKTWDSIGMLDREIALYRALRPHLSGVTFVTYGSFRDRTYRKKLDGIRIVCNRWRLPRRWYTWLLVAFYSAFLGNRAIVKSNQVQGADIALKAARASGKPFIARCGYLPSNIAIWKYGSASSEACQAQNLESFVFNGADKIVVTTSVIARTLAERYGVSSRKIHVIPNYVEVERFKPSGAAKQSNLVCFVGRLEQEKNIVALMDAIKALEVELMVIGGGNLTEAVMTKASQENLRVKFVGNVPNSELPRYLSRSALFVLPSHIEHHPKSLLEAMACGLPVIGTDVPGIRELIHHRETGLLCGTSAAEIQVAIRVLLDDEALRTKIGCNARDYVVEHFSLQRAVEKELEVLASLV